MGDAHGTGHLTSAHGARRVDVGGVWALCACALWALAFIAPAVSENTAALTLVRYAVFGISSALVLLLCRDAPLRQLDTRAWLRIIGLGLTGNTLYFWLMSAGVASAGPIPVALVFGALPVIMTVTANLRRPTVPWRSLAGPGAMVLLGIAVTTASAAANRETAGTSSPVTGMLLALAAVISWVVYGIWNAEHLHDYPATSTAAWASLTGIGTLITLPPFFLAAIGIEGGIRPLATAITPALLGWGLLLGLGASWGATWMWSRASSHLPTSVLGMLVLAETVFAVLYSCLLEARLPSGAELTAAALTVTGVLWALRTVASLRH